VGVVRRNEFVDVVVWNAVAGALLRRSCFTFEFVMAVAPHAREARQGAFVWARED